MMATSVASLLRLTNDLGGAIRIPALSRPTIAELQKEFRLIDRIESDFSPEGEVALALGTFLADREDMISGREYKRRIAPNRKEGLLLGYSQWNYLRRNTTLLASVPREVIYIDFPNTIVVDARGSWCFPYLHFRRNGEGWYSSWVSFVSDVYRLDRVALSAGK